MSKHRAFHTDLRILDGKQLGPAALLPGTGLVDDAAQPHRHRLLGVPAAKQTRTRITSQTALHPAACE